MLSSTLLYGAGDALVLLVGGFLLLPLYTHTLSQAEFGQYVVIRTGIELLTYLLHFGLLSAVARLYFDYQGTDCRRGYLSSVVMLFMLLLAAWLALLTGLGEPAWRLLAPGAPAQPYLWFSVAIAITGFFGMLASTWLRLDERAGAFAALQVTAAVALAVTAFVNLSVLSLGLPGLLVALLAAPAVSAAILPWQFRDGFRPRLQVAHARATLHYALPAVASLVAYFILNRISIVILQRHAPLDQVAVFGLAQQLALLISLTGVAFGKAMQPAVFGADPAAAVVMLQRFGTMLVLALTSVTLLLMLFAAELLAAVAPADYATGHGLLLILSIATFAYALSLLADTALLHQRRPRVSAALTLLGAALSTLLGLLLIPRYAVYGAAFAMAVAFATMTLLGQVAAMRLTGQSFLRMSLPAFALVCGVAVFAAWVHQAVPPPMALAVKTIVAGLLLAGLYRCYAQGDAAGMRAP
jgi:O-antigen/teichoic acid export membrane protein